MILFFGIYAPDIIFIFYAVYDIFDRLKGGHHGVIDIVVAVLPVAAHTVEIVDAL